MAEAATGLEQGFRARMWERMKKGWYTFSKNPLSLLGAVIIVTVVFLAVFAPLVSPYPEHAANFVDFDNASQPPSQERLFGTDVFGRDILSRVFFGFRLSLILVKPDTSANITVPYRKPPLTRPGVGSATIRSTR